MDINTCLETTQDYRVIAYYSHYIPLLITLVVSLFVLYKSKFSLLSISFFIFTGSFCLWLLGDVFAWTANDYSFVSFVWAPLDYINVVFYILGAYFFVLIVKDGKDISLWEKLIALSLSLPALWITVSNQSITVFYQPACEAFNNDFLSQYKFCIEILVIAFILFYAFFKGRKVTGEKRNQIIIVSSALTLFFGVFSLTEYISSQTGVYEINLYSLFVLPIFLFAIIYSITTLEIFKIRLIGSQLLAYVLIVMVGSQFFFIEDTTNKTLTVITFILSLGFGILLIRSGQRETKARLKIEKLASELEQTNAQLKELDRQKDELLGMVSHQLATPVSSIKWYLEMMKDGDLGPLSKEQSEHVVAMHAIGETMSDLVSMILDVSRIQLGRMRIEKQDLDLNTFFHDLVATIEPKALEKKVELVKNIPQNMPVAQLDRRYTNMTIENLLSNALKYTPTGGKVTCDVKIENGEIFVTVSDTGMGIPASEQDKIFGRMFRASNARNAVDGNGFGLFVAKGAVEAQGGKIWFESTEGKGTTFHVQLPLKD